MPASKLNSKCSSRLGGRPMAQTERNRRFSWLGGDSPKTGAGWRRNTTERFTPMILRNRSRNCLSNPSAFSEWVRTLEKSRRTLSVSDVVWLLSDGDVGSGTRGEGECAVG